MKIFAVIPAYGAAGTVRQVVLGLKPYVSEVVVVDDGSADATSAEASVAGAKVLKHFINRGYGAPLITGQTYA